MSWFDAVRAWWTFKQGNGHRGAKRLYIVDAAGVLGRGSSRLSPPECVQVLEKISRFAQKENIRMSAVFEGRALREVAHGGDFKGVAVYFAENAAGVGDQVQDLVKQGLRRGPVMVIAGDREMEERAQGAGAATMRTSTFRKALESVLGGGGGDNGISSPPPRHRRDRDRRRGRRSGPPSSEGGGGEKPPNDPVSSLVDLVD